MCEQISACVTAGNEEQKIRRCLASLTWCNEIVVVDSFSQDRTVEICRSFTDRVYQHPWRGYVEQKNLIREMARFPWILFVDADEEVSAALREEILARFERGVEGVSGFRMPRRVFYLGRWIRHGEWYPDSKLRLFRKNQGRTEGQEPHDHVVVQGRVERLRAPLFHYTYDDIHDHLLTLDRFTSITARAKHEQGVRFHWPDLLLRPVWRFGKAYFWRRGFLDGLPGFLIALITAFGVYMKYAKLWELERAASPPTSAPAA